MRKQSEAYCEYFKHRNIENGFYSDYILPVYLESVLPTNKDAQVLDIGCGFGLMLLALKKKGYKRLSGVDISEDAVRYCAQLGLNAKKIDNLIDFCASADKRHDFIIMSHVLEHLEKSTIIETLEYIKKNLMNPEACLVVMVPNAQSNTGCYWAYEDFTHNTLFTAGSLFFVLKSAGFESVAFLDPDGLTGSRPVIKQLRKFFLFIYKMNIRFWNIVTNSSFHRPSPQIFTYELKALAK